MQQETQYDEHILTKTEKRLMEVLFHGKVTEQDIALFTSGLDVDTASSDYMLMLSYLGLKNRWEWFPKEMVPRIQGLHRYYQVRNAMGIKGALAQIDLLQREGISVMLIKGMAMRYHYAEGVPRIMSDMDLLVPEEQFERAVQILCAHGGEKEGQMAWAVHILNGIAALDLHRWMFKHHGKNMEELWARAVPIKFYGRTVYVPSAEDMFVHQIDTRAQAIFAFEAETRRMRWLYDCRMICEREKFDWDIVIERIKQFQIEYTAYFMLKAFSDCFPEILPESYLEKKISRPANYETWLERELQYRKAMEKREKVNGKGNILQYVFLWTKLRYYDYKRRKMEAEIMDGTSLSFTHYLKNIYNQPSVWACLQYLTDRAVKLYKRR